MKPRIENELLITVPFTHFTLAFTFHTSFAIDNGFRCKHGCPQTNFVLINNYSLFDSNERMTRTFQTVKAGTIPSKTYTVVDRNRHMEFKI